MRITIDPVAHPDISTITDTRQGHSIAFPDVVVDWPPVPTATRDLYRHHLAPELLGVRNLQRMDAAIDSAELQVGRVLSGFTRGGDPSKGGGRFARLNAIVFSVCESALYWVLLKDNDHRAIFWLPAGLVVFLSFYIGRMLLNSQDAGNRNMVDDGFPSPITSRIIVATSSAVLLLIVSFGSFRGVLFVVITALILFGSHISGLEAMMSDRSIPGRRRSFIVSRLIAILPAIAAYSYFAAFMSITIEVLWLGQRLVVFSLGRFRLFIIVLGVLLFTAGTVMQFVATFLPVPGR